jgi:putative transposase
LGRGATAPDAEGHSHTESVFECASNDATQALKNWSDSKKGGRKGPAVGFPKFSAKNHSVPSFRLRNRVPEGTTQAIRFADSTHLRLPKIGPVKVFGNTRKLRKMLENLSISSMIRGGSGVLI